MHKGVLIALVIVALFVIIYILWFDKRFDDELEDLEEIIKRKKKKIIKCITTGGVRGFLMGLLKNGSLYDAGLTCIMLGVINPIMLYFD